MTHQIALGTYNLIKQSKAGYCVSKVVGSSSLGEIVLQHTAPVGKLWCIQQLSTYNGTEPGARNCALYLADELNNFVVHLSNTGRAKQSVNPGDSATYDGFGLVFIPEGWSVGVRWFGLTVVGSVSFYAHVTEIDLA